MGTVIERRRAYTKSRLDTFVEKLTEADKIVAGKACVYVTGSGGRGEMSKYSDLDVFIVSDIERRKDSPPPGEGPKPLLSRLEGIVVKANLIKAADGEFPPFSKDGKYLETYTTEGFCENLGTTEDDHTNTFTARLLLLLESRALLGEATYRRAIDDVIASYWEDYTGHRDSFRPVFLINDITRLWKTLCVNYEAYTEQQPEEKRAKRKLQNYKLKHSRVLTCYSAIIYLMQVFGEQGTVHDRDVQTMVSKSPTERLEWTAARPGFVHEKVVWQILEQYEQFLESINREEIELIDIFKDRQKARDFTVDAHKLRDSIADLLQRIGATNDLYRYLIV